MPVATYGYNGITLSVSVYDRIHVLDIANGLYTKVVKIVRSIQYYVEVAMIRLGVLKNLFANMRNHSSPPEITNNDNPQLKDCA